MSGCALFCGCAHVAGLHEDDAGRCTVSLPPFEEEELPAWACPCRRFTLQRRPGTAWRWHAGTGSWEAAAS